MEADLGIPPARHGFLEHWAKQGVLLLNSVLTVRMGQAASHRERGWERFTDAAIAAVNRQEDPVVFLLWGSYAQKKAALVDSIDKGGRHLVLKAPHPSPLSAHSGFFGCRHFSKANEFLESRGLGADRLGAAGTARPEDLCSRRSPLSRERFGCDEGEQRLLIGVAGAVGVDMAPGATACSAGVIASAAATAAS